MENLAGFLPQRTRYGHPWFNAFHSIDVDIIHTEKPLVKTRLCNIYNITSGVCMSSSSDWFRMLQICGRWPKISHSDRAINQVVGFLYEKNIFQDTNLTKTFSTHFHQRTISLNTSSFPDFGPFHLHSCSTQLLLKYNTVLCFVFFPAFFSIFHFGFLPFCLNWHYFVSKTTNTMIF